MYKSGFSVCLTRATDLLGVRLVLVEQGNIILKILFIYFLSGTRYEWVNVNEKKNDKFA